MGNSNTSSSSPALEAALADIPAMFRHRIVISYLETKKRYNEAVYDGSFDSAGLSSGKLTESVLRFLQHYLTGTHIPFGKNIPNLADECRKLIGLPSTAGIESLRVIIPRALVLLYTLRGKRGIGHVGGDVEANAIDTATILRVADWIVCELIRVFHHLSLEEAQAIVDALSARNIPMIWEVGGVRRVLRTDLDYKQMVLPLAYDNVDGVMVEDLFKWTEYSNLAMFKKSLLGALHKSRFIEYDRQSECVYLSPLGIQEVEEKILCDSRKPSGRP